MSDYGVPDDPAGALPWGWAEERLVPNQSYWLVTASASGRPHSMPVWGVWLPEADRFWCSCSPNARKARNIAENPQCVVTVDDTVECVSVEGRARIVDPARDAGAIDLAVAAYVAKYWGDPADHPAQETFVRSHALIEVTPERAFGIIEREDEFSQRATRWAW
jgi:general stress protein 26